MTKYKLYLQKMLSENKEDFERFQKIHDAYSLNPDDNQLIFNQIGEKVLEIVHEYENRLCAITERGIYNKYSANLAEKFQNEVRKYFPMIDYIGLIPQNSKTKTPVFENVFSIKKIKLF